MLDPRISTNSDAVLEAEGCNVATSKRKKLSTTEYSLEIRQHPLNARACGFGPKDRRAIDPPPILQLRINDASLTPEKIQKELRDRKYVANCFLYDANGTHDVTLILDEQQQSIQQLSSRTTSAHFYGKYEAGKEGCFFPFPDLSCRHTGSFQLKFTVMKIDLASAKKVPRQPVLAEVYSGSFTVFEANKFPGMQPSTDLAKALNEQGCWIPFKKGNGKSKKDGNIAYPGDTN
ncbi:hypothetical protein FPRO04_13638 [Fusarium proliferatum]|nr:hypothetical protein FPRO04_13638 [Fusarium proliferatum]